MLSSQSNLSSPHRPPLSTHFPPFRSGHLTLEGNAHLWLNQYPIATLSSSVDGVIRLSITCIIIIAAIWYVCCSGIRKVIWRTGAWNPIAPTFEIECSGEAIGAFPYEEWQLVYWKAKKDTIPRLWLWFQSSMQCCTVNLWGFVLQCWYSLGAT